MIIANLLHHIVDAAQAAGEVTNVRIEPGFTWNFSIGQVAQVFAILIPFLSYAKKVTIRHAMVDRDMMSLKEGLEEVRLKQKVLIQAISHIPNIVKVTQSNHRILQNVMSNNIKDRLGAGREPGLILDESAVFEGDDELDELGKTLREMGRDNG